MDDYIISVILITITTLMALGIGFLMGMGFQAGRGFFHYLKRRKNHV